MGRTALLVDDDRLPMQFYVKALRQKGFSVKQCLEPDSALEFAKTREKELSAIILDIMMPPGKAYELKDTREGLRTGLFLLEDLMQYCPDVPVVVLTNVRNPNTLGELKAKTKQVVHVLQKGKYPPFELAELVTEIVAKREGGQGHR